MRTETAVCLDVMAETSANNRRRVYWTNTVMDSSSGESDAFIPGLSKPGNMRHRVKGRKTPEVKANISMDRPVESIQVGKDILVHDLSQSLDGHSQRRHIRKASFKDLRIEDKKRVANLIKELAKAGDEKDQVVSQLHEERQQYETQILQLVSQQEDVLREREDIQVKLFETQQLLQQYQEQVIQEEQQKRSRQQQHQHHQQQHHHQQVPQDDSVRFSPRAWRAHYSEEEKEADLKVHPIPEDVNQNRGITHRPVPEFYPPKQIHNPQSLQNHFTDGRPYTTLIDREIAQERQQSMGHPHREKDTGRHKKKSGKSLGPLREPIMSSTQKSSQIAEISFNSLPTINSENFEPLPLDSSPRTTLGFNDPVFRKNERNRVGFAERVENLDSARIHSPVLEGNEVVGDQQFLDYYKKLTPAERKRELLRQRSALLEEQNRLKYILSEQERQLQEKQLMLNLRHQQRLRECEDVRLQVQRETEKKNEGDKEQRDKRNSLKNNDPVEKPVGIEEVAKRLNMSELSSRSNSASESSGRHSATRQLKSAGTSPMNFQTHTSVGTSPVRLTQLDLEKSDLPDLVDAGTSVSYAHITRSPQQSNLPLHVNRQRTSPARKGLQSPGDKTLAILEIVNSLDRLSDSLTGSMHSQDGSINRHTPRSQSSDPPPLDRDNPVEELEESRILEEVQRETEKKNEGDKEQRDKRNSLKNNDPVEKPVGIEEVAKRLNMSELSSRSNSASESSGRHSATRQLKSAGTSPMNFQTHTSVGTSPVRLTQLDLEKSDLPDLVDAGTSVSYAHMTRSPQQSNLPLHVNRQRTSPARKGLQSPGDKTLAILEIVNSLDRLSDSLTGSMHSQDGSINRHTPRSQSSDPPPLDRDNPVEELEESRILEEVFFMK